MMQGLALPPSEGPLEVLALGAHADDIEIGCGGTLLQLLARREVHVTWVVLAATGQRAQEAHASAAAFLKEAQRARVVVEGFRDGFLPWQGAEVKERFEALKHEVAPYLVLTHRRDDAHQDHRLVAELTWNTFRDHLILEYEVPKYDGDLAPPNLYVPLPAEACDRKVELLLEGFPSQRGRRWFTAETFRALLRLRGVEAGADHAEAFHTRKLVWRP